MQCRGRERSFGYNLHAIAAGIQTLGWASRPSEMSRLQAAAAVGQMNLIQAYEGIFAEHGLITAQILLTHEDLSDRQRYLNARATLNTLLELGVVPIINENDTIAIEEIKVGDNDTLSAQVASLLKADLLVLLTDVDGLYTANPNSDPTAEHLPEIKEITEDLFAMAAGAGSSNGTGGMTTKLQAAQIATKSGVPVFICSSKEDTALLQAVSQANRGTLFLADEHAMNQRKQWMAFYARTDATVEVDAGAVEAMLHQGRSLLVAGVKAIEGDFGVGQVVEVYSQSEHRLIGKGRVKLSSEDLQNKLKNGRAEGVLIHRNDWVSL